MQSGHRGRSHELHLTCVSRPECLKQYKASAVEVSMSATTTSPANDGRADTPPHLVWGRGSPPSGKNDGRLPSPLPLLQKAGPTPASMHPLSHATRTASLPVSAHVLRPPGCDRHARSAAECNATSPHLPSSRGACAWTTAWAR